MAFPIEHRTVVGIRMVDSEFVGQLYIPVYRENGPFLEDLYKMLNDRRMFLPIAVETPPFLILSNKENIVWIDWEFPSFEERNAHGAWEKLERAKMFLVQDVTFEGHIAMLELTQGYERLQDFLNQTSFFIPFLDAEKPHVYFIGRKHIIRIEHTGD